LLLCRDEQLRNTRGVHVDWRLFHSRHQ
jgi:hypothetical protein